MEGYDSRAEHTKVIPVSRGRRVVAWGMTVCYTVRSRVISCTVMAPSSTEISGLAKYMFACNGSAFVRV